VGRIEVASPVAVPVAVVVAASATRAQALEARLLGAPGEDGLRETHSLPNNVLLPPPKRAMLMRQRCVVRHATTVARIAPAVGSGSDTESERASSSHGTE
jgi:hypothetical protein